MKHTNMVGDKKNFIVKIGKDINTQDIDEMHTLLNWENYRSDQWPVIKKQSTFMVQVLIGKKTIGFARCVDDTEMCMIYDVVVHPDHQKKGIGTILMNEILKYVKTQNFASVSLFYYIKNKGLDSFYRKFGFEIVPNAMRLKK